jgi:DNA-binding NarL/FixJ family response regulator
VSLPQEYLIQNSRLPVNCAAAPDAEWIRIVLVEKHRIMRECVEALLHKEADCAVVGGFGSLEQALDAIGQLKPDVLLTDLALPGRSGLHLLLHVKTISPLTRTVVLTAHAEVQYVCAALEAGADGYVLKTSGIGELMKAIRSVSRGVQFLSGAVPIEAITIYRARRRPPWIMDAPRAITKREREILTCIVEGHSSKVTARLLGLSPKTVAKHRSNLMGKLQRHNVSELTLYAFQNGITGRAELVDERVSCAARNAAG